jgi:hypothetical protein
MEGAQAAIAATAHHVEAASHTSCGGHAAPPKRRPARRHEPRQAGARQPPAPTDPAELAVASWNATGLTMQKVEELLTLAREHSTMVVAGAGDLGAGRLRLAAGRRRPRLHLDGVPPRGWRRRRRRLLAGIAAQASAHTEPRAQQDDNELELLWLHLTVRQRKRAAIQLHLASTYMPNSAKAAGVVDAAWEALEEAVATKASTAGGHCIVLGDLNARLPPADGPDCQPSQRQAGDHPGEHPQCPGGAHSHPRRPARLPCGPARAGPCAWRRGRGPGGGVCGCQQQHVRLTRCAQLHECRDQRGRDRPRPEKAQERQGPQPHHGHPRRAAQVRRRQHGPPAAAAAPAGVCGRRASCPERWRKGVIQYFHKSGSKTDMANYRGITLLDTISKLFNRVLADRLLTYAEETTMLHEAQNAFRRGRSTDQHIYTLSQVLRGRLRQGKATYAFFLDLKQAYDTVWRDGLLYKLWNRGIRGRGSTSATCTPPPPGRCVAASTRPSGLA